MSELEDRINAATMRRYWRIRRDQGQHVPTRELLALLVEDLEAFREVVPAYMQSELVVETDRWLQQNQVRIRMQIAQEEGRA